MSRLSTESVEKAVDAVQAMDRAQKERLADEIFRMQPNMLGSILVLPRLGGEFGELVETQAQAIVQDASGRLDLIAEETDGLLEALSESPVGLSSMGRGVDRDEAYFVSHAAAGRAVARLASR